VADVDENRGLPSAKQIVTDALHVQIRLERFGRFLPARAEGSRMNSI